MGEMTAEPTGWTNRERALAASAGLIAILIVLLLGVAILPRGGAAPLAADTSPSPQASPTRPPEESASPSSPSPEPTPAPTATPTPTPDPSDVFSADALADLSTYRFALRMDGSGSNSPLVPIEGVVDVTGVVTTDPEAIDIVITNLVGPGSSIRIVAIGSEAWVDDGTGSLVAVAPEESDSVRRAVDTYQPENLFARSIGELPSDAILVGTTTRAGVMVEEYRMDPETMDGLGGAAVIVEGGFAIHAELGVPVWTDIVFTNADDPTGTFRMSFEILDLNDPTIVIEPPGSVPA